MSVDPSQDAAIKPSQEPTGTIFARIVADRGVGMYDMQQVLLDPSVPNWSDGSYSFQAYEINGTRGLTLGYRVSLTRDVESGIWTFQASLG